MVHGADRPIGQGVLECWHFEHLNILSREFRFNQVVRSGEVSRLHFSY